MTRQNSIDAFNEIKANGSLSKRRIEIFEVIVFKADMDEGITCGEIGSEMSHYRSSISTADRNIHARVKELKDYGVIEEVKDRVCRITGMNVFAVRPTGLLPKKIEKKEASFIWWVFFPKTEERPKLFRHRHDAIQYKLKSESSGNIYEVEQFKN